MEGDLLSTLEVIPFDDKYAVKAQIEVSQEAQPNYICKSFLMIVLELRSGMNDVEVINLRKRILEMCEDGLERGGITGIGFVINENYYTIRQPNYEGIKDLLMSAMKIVQNVDFLGTLQCLRHSIMNETKKMEDAKLSLLIFTSSVAFDPERPQKLSTMVMKNKHIPNYDKEIKRIRKVIQKNCIDSYTYMLGYSNINKCEKLQNKMTHLNFFEKYMTYFTDVFDANMLFDFAYCSHSKTGFFMLAHSFSQLQKQFQTVSALLLYERHNFSLMVPVRADFVGLMNKEQLFEKKEEIQEKQDQQEDEEFDEEEFQVAAQPKQNIKYRKLTLTNNDQTIFKTKNYTFFDKKELDLNVLHDEGFHLLKKIKEKVAQPKIKEKLRKKLQSLFQPQYTSKKVDYHDPQVSELINCEVTYYQKQLEVISQKILRDIISYKRKYIGNGKFEYYTEVDEDLQYRLRQRVLFIEEIARKIYKTIFQGNVITKSNEKRKFFELYSTLKLSIDSINETIMKILKKQIKNDDIGRLSEMVSYTNVRASIKRKLVKRINGNPKMLDQISEKIQNICKNQFGDYVDLEAQNHLRKAKLGNCMYTDFNFVKALKERDCLCLVFETQRPDTAIMDPGRLRIRQISPLLICANKFFEINQFGIRNYEPPSQQVLVQQTHLFERKMKKYEEYQTYMNAKRKHRMKEIPKNYDDDFVEEMEGQMKKMHRLKEISEKNTNTAEQKLEKSEDQLRYFFDLEKQNYTERWDYWDRVSKCNTSLGIMPLYGCDENWKVAKLLMKPCLGWTACAQPLGYTFSQYQTIPFMVLSFMIRHVQQLLYEIQQKQKQCLSCKDETKFYKLEKKLNKLKSEYYRYRELLEVTEETCNVIMKELSKPQFQEKLCDSVLSKYTKYQKPINRTVDVINNNSSFLGQIYSAIQTGMMKKPTEQQFHEFFKRLIEEELRRQTDGWNQEEVQEKFINKLLNIHVEEMEKPEYIVVGSVYHDRFQQALKGKTIYKTTFQIERQSLEMMLKENNSFNDTQKMLLIEYKRLYENRVLWFWYIRFVLFGEKERISIHKWKCLDLINSYMLFTLIIQNKKQRKNSKRRNVILQNLYTDPFDYYAARKYLEEEFMKMRNNKEKKNIMLLEAEKYRSAADTFSESPDIDEAAGALMNVGIGQEINFYYDELRRGKSRRVEKKLMLLLNGEYKGVQLMKTGWKMSGKRMRILERLYPLEFSRYRYLF